MSARIFKPSKSATQSGLRNTRKWILEFIPEKGHEIDPMTGWVGGDQIYPQQVRLLFKSLEDAVHYAKNAKLDFQVLQPHTQTRKIKNYLSMYKR